jgi:uncharacterized membrane-anchored protein YhcB (DUF1043 family)
MKSLKAWLLLGLVFIVGVLFGVAGSRLVVRHMVREAILHPARVQLAIQRQLTRKIGLDENQQSKLDGILTDAHQHVETIRKEFRPAMVQVFSNANEQITVMLKPEQLARYQKIKEDNAVFLRGLQSEP